MNRIENKFRELKNKKKKAFIVFITCGYPSLEVTRKLILEFSKIGVDIVELGVPFSDPMADGPIIQDASQYALAKGINLDQILALVKSVRKSTDIPICLMTYYNPVFCFGEKRFAKLSNLAGVDGIIIPDLPPEEAKPLINSAKSNKLEMIFFLSPTSTKKRIRLVAGASQGFIYYISLTGVTGIRQKLPPDLVANLKAVKKITRKPVCIGFGISSSKQVREVYKIADGVIIGSAVIKKIKDSLGKSELVKKVSNFVKGLNV